MAIYLTPEFVEKETRAHAEIAAIRGLIESRRYEYSENEARTAKQDALIATLPDVARRVAECHNAGVERALAEQERQAVREIATRLAGELINSGAGESNAKVVADSLEIARGIVEATKAPAALAPEATVSNV